MPAKESVPSAQPFEPGFPLIRWLLNGSAFLATLVITSALLGRWLPYPNIPITGEKIRYLSLHGNEFDTIFIGSSRVNFGILPSVFDKMLGSHGKASKSFNAGLLGMRPPEQGYYLDQVLRQPHGRLRWVLIELTSLEARTPPTRRSSARFMSWHDWRRMALIWTWMRGEWAALYELSLKSPDEVRWTNYWEPPSVWLAHFPPFCKASLNLGRGGYLAENWLLPRSKRARELNKWRSLGADRDGWTPYSESETMDEKMRAHYQQTYEARLAAPAEHFHDPGSDAAMDAMLKAVRATGATPIFFIPPMTSDRHYFPPPEMAKDMIIWNFSDVQRYPELFAEESRLDYIHLNPAGARHFSRALAERFLESAR